MSFQDICHGLEPRLPPPPPLQVLVSHSVFQINTRVATLWRLADALASCRGDAAAVRERIRRTRAEATRLARNAARKLADAGHGDVEAVPKLAADFEAALREFQRVLRRVIAADRRETASASAAFLRPFFSPPSYDDAPSSRTTTTQVQQHRDIQTQHWLVGSRRTQDLTRLADNDQVTFNEALIEEREQELFKIQQGINEIDEIIRDLAAPVHGQHHQIIEIGECDPGAAATETAQAKAQLAETAMTQGETELVTKYVVIAAVGLVVFILVLLCSL